MQIKVVNFSFYYIIFLFWQGIGTAPFLPPPPAFETLSEAATDKEALYSMLISWYMSGYHTGYYQVSAIQLCLFRD